MNILQRDLLPRGGFAGLKETRLIKDSRIGGDSETSDGLGDFVYLADARYLPYGQTNMHSHHEVDVITIMLEGRLNHEGSLKDGQSMQAGQIQVQRAGGEGFSHNEVNPDKSGNRLLQLWVLPETAGSLSAYKFYTLSQNEMTRIYGGSKAQSATFDSHTCIDVGILERNVVMVHTGEFLAYISHGEALLNGKKVSDGDLIRDHGMNLTVTSSHCYLTLITVTAY